MALWFLTVLLAYGPWESIGPEGAELVTPAQSNLNGDYLYAVSGSKAGGVVFGSTDRGLNWEMLSSFTGYTPIQMVITASGTLVQAAYDVVRTSTDGGYSWSEHPLTQTQMYDIAVHPTQGSTLFATGGQHDGTHWRMVFLKSTDSGASWTSTYLAPPGGMSFGRSIAVSRSNPDVILAGGSMTSGTTIPLLVLSTNGGASFSDVTPSAASGEYYFLGAGIHPTNPQALLASTYNGMYRSTNGGTSWTRVQSLSSAMNLRYSIINPDLVLAAGQTHIYRSTNGGQNWSLVNSGLSGGNMMWVLPDTENSMHAYTVSNNGFFRSVTEGATWIASNGGLISGDVVSMTYSNGHLWANISYRGLYRLPDDGSWDWEYMSTPSTCGDFVRMASNGGNVLMGLEGAG